MDPPPPDSRVLVLLGEAGMGKTVLLADAERQARSAGLRVLSAAGRESERDLAFAGLHQLLRPVLATVPDIPLEQGVLLQAALGLDQSVLADLYRTAGRADEAAVLEQAGGQ